MTPAQIQRALSSVALAAAAATGALVLALSDGGGRQPWTSVFVVALLGSMPYAAFVMIGRWAVGVPTAQLAVFGTLIVTVFFAAGIFALAFAIDPTPGDVSAFVQVPLLQSVGVALAGVATSLLRLRARAEGPR